MSISNFEYKKMSITCLSPVHITDETGTVYSYQYLYDAASRRVYFLNERLWVKFLYEHNLLGEFEELIKTRLRAGTLCEWIQAKGFSIADLDGAVTDYARVEVAPEILAANKTRLTEIVRTVHSVDGHPYIPGSSIKGALRTGLLFSLLLQEDKLRTAAWDELCRILSDSRIRDKGSALGSLAQKLEFVLLHRLKIPKNEYGGELLPQSNMNCSIMKGLSVSDSYCEGKNVPVIVQKREAVFITKTGGIKTKNLNFFRECLPQGAHQHFSITLDKAVFKDINILSVSELIKRQKDFTNFVLEREKLIFGGALKQEFAKSANANIFLGSGSGFLSKSLLLALAPNQKSFTSAAAIILHNNFYKHAHLRLDKLTAPRGLQTAKTRKGMTLMGVCAIAEE